MSTPSKPRRTSVSSTTSRTSTKSSWRVPLAKQIPRTQLSAVFAESEIPVSRSPGNQSAVAYLEARYNTSGASSSSFKAPGISPSPSVDGLRVSPSAQPVLMEESSEIGSSQNPNSAEGTSKYTGNLDYGNSGRGRQATQRHISLTGDSVPAAAAAVSNGIIAQSSTVSIHITNEGELDPSRPNIAVHRMDRQPTFVQQTREAPPEDRKGKQSTVTGGWFGSSGKAKSQKIQQSIQAQDEFDASNSTLSRDATIKAVPAASSPPRESIKSTTQVPTSSSWFSRSRTSTPASASPAPIPQSLPSTNTSNAHPPNVTIPIRPPPLSITAQTQEPAVAPIAASPARSSWFGNSQARNQASTSVAPDTNQSANSSTRGTPAIQTTDLPTDSSEDSEIDEAMVATVTPATFAQAQKSDTLALSANRAAVPTGWFRMNGKRGSMTPSVDSHVPTLPPTPQRELSPPRTALVAIDTLMPLASPSLSTLGSSSARYTLSFPIRGRNKGSLEETLRQLVEAPVEPGKPESLGDWVLVLKSQSDSRALIPRSRATPVVRKPRNKVVIEERVEEMVLEQGDTAINGSSAASVASSHRPSSAWWPFGWTMPPSQDLHPPMAAPAEPPSVSVSAAPSHEARADTTQPLPSNGASWLGIWPWGPGTSDTAVPAKTEAELIKEQALARDKDSLPTPPLSSETVRQSDITPRPQNYERNPLADNVSENRASWVNFFSLKAAHGTRKITLEEGEEEGDEEVMDLSEDPDFPPPAPPGPVPEPIGVKGKVSNFLALKAVSGSSKRSSSAGPDSKKRSSSATPPKKTPVPKQPNIVLPTFEETFYTLPRALPPYIRPTSLKKVGKLVSGVLGISTEPTIDRRSPMKQWQRERKVEVPRDYESLRTSREVGRDLPRIGEVLGVSDVGAIRECKRIAILGVHGWFPGAIMRTLLGEPTGTSPKFASMMEAAVKEFMDAHNMQPEKITCMPLEGEGTIEKRVEKLYQNFLAKPEWVEDLHEADVIFVATHSQGSIVSTQLLDRFIQDGHIRTSKNWEIVRTVLDTAAGGIGITIPAPRPAQRVCCLALCGIHLGPLLYLGTSSLVNPYIQYFESGAAKELFEFQDTESEVSKRYQVALENVLDHGAKFVYVASLDDQVVPIYSGVFTAVNHPRILRALYMDGDAYSTSDFLSNLLVLLLKMRNAGLDDGGLLMHLSEATAGSLSGLGHSTAYLDPGAYKLAVRFLFESSDALGEDPKFEFEPFTAKASRNDYEIPWALRGLITDPQCQELFGKEINELRSAFDDWQPKTSALKEVRKKLEPIRGRRSSKL